MTLLTLNDAEKGKLIYLAQDKALIEGLKKMFFTFFIKRGEGDVQVKAAAVYSVEFLEEAFRDLENLSEQVMSV